MRKYISCLSLCGNSIYLLLSICDNDFVCGLCYIGLYLYKYTDNEFGVIVIIIMRLYLHMAMRYVYLWGFWVWIYLCGKYIRY